MRPKCSYWVGHHSPTEGKESPEQDPFQGQLLLILHWQRPLSTQLRCKQLRVRQGMLTHVDTWLGYRLQSGYLPQGLLHHSFSQDLSLLEVCLLFLLINELLISTHVHLPTPRTGVRGTWCHAWHLCRCWGWIQILMFVQQTLYPWDIPPTPFVVSVLRMHQTFTVIWNTSFNHFPILNILHNFGLL